MPKTLPWIRLYVEILDDPKVGMLPPHLKWPWVEYLLVNEKSGGALPSMAQMVFMLRRDEVTIKAELDALVAAGLIDRATNGTLIPHNWGMRQFRIDKTNAQRQQRFKEKRKRVTATAVPLVTALVTPLVTTAVTVIGNGKVTEPTTQTGNGPQIQNTDSEAERRADSPSLEAPPESSGESSNRGEIGARVARITKGNRLSEDWSPSPSDLAYAATKGLTTVETATQSERFRNHWHAKAGKDALKLNWPKTWQNWVLTAVEHKATRPAAAGAVVAFKPKAPPRIALDAPVRDEQQWIKLLTAYNHRNEWDRALLGPTPLEPGCYAPSKLVAQYAGIKHLMPKPKPIMVNGQAWGSPVAPASPPTAPDFVHHRQEPL